MARWYTHTHTVPTASARQSPIIATTTHELTDLVSASEGMLFEAPKSSASGSLCRSESPSIEETRESGKLSATAGFAAPS